jgi:hypothetical protein
MGRVSTSSPARDVERHRAGRGGAVLDAVLERITYANEETGYTIARVATDLWVPETPHTLRDLLILGEQATEPVAPWDACCRACRSLREWS